MLLFIAFVAEWPLEYDVVMYNGLWRSPFVVFGYFFVPLPGVKLFLWQLLVLAMVPVCIARRKAFKQRAKELDRALLVSVFSIAVTFGWGLARGGEPYFAYYQVWRFLAGLLFAFLLTCALRSTRDLRTLGMCIVSAAVIRALLCIYFYWTQIRGSSYELEYLTNHDDAILCVAAVLVLANWAVVSGRLKAWLLIGMLFPVLFYAMVLNERRIAWVELAGAAMASYFMLGPGPLRRRIHRVAIVAAPLALVYVAVGWGREGAIFAPVKALSSAGSSSDPSSLTRQEEVRNLLYTFSTAGNPIFGTGWGLPFHKVESVWSNYSADWIFDLYTPHNSLLGLAVFAGIFGILGIWGVVPIGAWLAARAYNQTTDTTIRSSAMAVVGCLVAYSVHCYGDIGFQSFTCGLILGTALGVAGKLAPWAELSSAGRPVRISRPSQAAVTSVR
ncbi:MAG: O-antigen ligase family protein [Planctomycetota bacterium]